MSKDSDNSTLGPGDVKQPAPAKGTPPGKGGKS
jgi:hypothetical protein